MDDELEGIAASPSERQPSAQTRALRRWPAAHHRAYAEAVTLCEFCNRETSPSGGGGGGGGGCACARCLCGSPIRSSLLPRPNGSAGEPAAFPGEHFLCRPCQEKVQFEIAEWFGDAKPGRRGTSSLRDLVQEFYARELARGAFPRFDPARVNGGDVERGFRGYLKEAAKNFCKGKAEEFRRLLHRAQPIDNVAETSHDVTGELQFHRDWLHSLVKAALACLRKRRTSKGCDERKQQRQMEFDYLLSHVVSLEPDYAEIALHFGCSKETARKKIHDLRKAIREGLRESVADTLDVRGLDADARDRLVDREIRELIALFKNDALGAFTEIAVTHVDEMLQHLGD